MLYRRKPLVSYLRILLSVASLIIVIHLSSIHLPSSKCFIPLSVYKLFIKQIRFHDNICDSFAEDESTYHRSERDDSKMDIKYPRYVALKYVQGRLGNQLFQTAAVYGMAATLGYKPYIDQAHPLLPYFEMSPPTPVNLTNNVDLSEEECIHGSWRCRKDIYSHNITVSGYLQSQTLFSHIAPTIRKLFTIKPYYRQPAKVIVDKLKSKNKTIIGIHVRRGDFGEMYYRCHGYTLATSNFFRKAMQLYRNEIKNAFFVVISDDMVWCRENIAGDDVIYSSFEDPIKDLALMSLCDNMIITGGTFGFWGAWLSGGNVIYLNDWPRPGSWLDIYGMIKEDFWSPDWVGISNSASCIQNSRSFIAIWCPLSIFYSFYEILTFIFSC